MCIDGPYRFATYHRFRLAARSIRPLGEAQVSHFLPQQVDDEDDCEFMID